MVTKRPPSLPSWAEAVREILAAACIPEARLAEAMGVSRKTGHKYFTAKSPKKSTMRRVNAFTAKLLGEDVGVYQYLNAIALTQQKANEPASKSEVEWALEESIDQIRMVSRHMVHDAEDQIFNVLVARWRDPTQRPEVFRLTAQLLAVHRQRLLRHLTGRVPRISRVGEVCEILEHHGIDSHALMLPDHARREVIAEDEFYLEVARVVRDAGAEPSKRWRLEQRIVAAHERVIQEAVKSIRAEANLQTKAKLTRKK